MNPQKNVVKRILNPEWEVWKCDQLLKAGKTWDQITKYFHGELTHYVHMSTLNRHYHRAKKSGKITKGEPVPQFMIAPEEKPLTERERRVKKKAKKVESVAAEKKKIKRTVEQIERANSKEVQKVLDILNQKDFDVDEIENLSEHIESTRKTDYVLYDAILKMGVTVMLSGSRVLDLDRLGKFVDKIQGLKEKAADGLLSMKEKGHSKRDTKPGAPIVFTKKVIRPAIEECAENE